MTRVTPLHPFHIGEVVAGDVGAEIWLFLHRPRPGEWSDESGRSGYTFAHMAA